MAIVCALAVLLQASISYRDLFRQAESAYEEGRFDEAVAEYEALLTSGLEDAALYYNLGNAYFKNGQLGRAILSYERALRLMPGDDDTEANLEYAYSLIGDAPQGPTLPSYVAGVVSLYRSLTADGLALALSVVFLVGGAATTGIIVGTRTRALAVYALVACGFLALLVGGVLGIKLHQESNRREAIVLVSGSEVRSGPGATQPELVEVPEGLKLTVIGSREDWLQVALPNGLTGWIRRDDVGLI